MTSALKIFHAESCQLAVLVQHLITDELGEPERTVRKLTGVQDDNLNVYHSESRRQADQSIDGFISP